jgi:cardiolipin synthase (CMP-forming)
VTLAQLPNLICVGRMLLTVPIAAAVLAGAYPLALALFLLAAFSDGLDGFLAKRCGWRSDLGAILDPLADKLLLVTLFIVLALRGRLPYWLAGAAVGRDLVILAGAIAYRIVVGTVKGEPTRISKLNTLLQLMLVLAIILDAAYPLLPAPLITLLGAATFLTTIVSGLNYVLSYSRRAIAAGR